VPCEKLASLRATASKRFEQKVAKGTPGKSGSVVEEVLGQRGQATLSARKFALYPDANLCFRGTTPHRGGRHTRLPNLCFLCFLLFNFSLLPSVRCVSSEPRHDSAPRWTSYAPPKPLLPLLPSVQFLFAPFCKMCLQRTAARLRTEVDVIRASQTFASFASFCSIFSLLPSVRCVPSDSVPRWTSYAPPKPSLPLLPSVQFLFAPFCRPRP
jgi:hypothetical protein